jgi:hypothetical protein
VLEFLRVTATTLGTHVRTVLAQLRGPAGEPYDAQEVGQPLGLTARPGRPAGETAPVTVEALCARQGDDVVVLAVVDKSLPALTGLDEGETRLHGAATGNVVAQVRITAAGAIEVTSKAGTDVICNAGTLKVARVTDPVRVGTLAGTAGPWPCQFTFTPHDPDGVPGTPSVGASVTLAGVVSNAGGAARVKA